VVGDAALGEDEAFPDHLETEAGVEPAGAVPGVAPQHRHPVVPEAPDHGGDEEPPESVVLGRLVDRHPPEVDGPLSRPVRGAFGAEAGHRQDPSRTAVTGVRAPHGEVEGSGPGVFRKDDRRPGPAVP
jgi:hypothetical protein